MLPPTMGTFLSDSSNQRKIAVALCAFLALFSAKVPLLADVKPEMLMALIAAIGGWVLQSGIKSAAQAHADGQVAAAAINTATDATATFNAIAANPKNNLEPLPPAPAVAKAG